MHKILAFFFTICLGIWNSGVSFKIDLWKTNVPFLWFSASIYLIENEYQKKQKEVVTFENVPMIPNNEQ